MKKYLFLSLLSLVAFSRSLIASETPEARLAAMGITLKESARPIANYVPAVRSGNLIYLSGQVPRDTTGKFITGKVGHNFTEEEAVEAAKICAIALINALKAEVGDLSKVTRIVKVTGYVNATEHFTQQPKIINGASDLLVAVFGDKGKHARAAVGVASLPAGVPVEVDLIAEVAN